MFEMYPNKKPLYGLRKFQRTAHYCNENRDDKIEFLTQTFLSVYTYAFLL